MRAMLVMASAFWVATTGYAQSTGNPKGTVTPTETAAPKPSASGMGRAGANDSGRLVGSEAQTRARMQGAKPPGGGTEGGLQRKDATESSNSSAARSDKGSATTRPLPPSK
jgi:hypothetical protein